MMARAIELALEGAGRTSPNPMVGAVVVRDGAIVGEGFHAKAGRAHAEARALADAGRGARGADLYVTLEPCCHEGRTPPCVDAIVRAGVGRVIMGTRDPNPLVNGRGARALRKAGIEVVEGILRARCAGINEAYNKHVTTGMPFVTAKVALTLDGKIAAGSGHSRWITGGPCREFVHGLRARSDAVMVGAGTVRSDDPRLTARAKGSRGRQPVAVVVDEGLNLPRGSRIFSRPRGGLILVTTRAAAASRVEWARAKGHEVMLCRATARGLVDIESALAELGRRGIVSLLLEGGGRLFASFMKAGLVDRLVACVAPRLVGAGGLDFLPGMGVQAMGDAISLRDVRVTPMGEDVVIEGYPKFR